MKNLLFIHAHDAGRCISPYGFGVQTPHLAGLAREGVVLRDAHCAAPTCSPSRAAMWTGLTAHENGMLGLVHRGFDLRDRGLHLMAHLGACGYRTALAGIQHEYNPDPASGSAIYGEILPLEPRPLETRDFHCAERAAAFLERPPEGPWALSVGFFYPHREFLPAEPGAAEGVKVPDPLPDLAPVREDFARYAASVAEMDRCVGRVLQGLAASGQENDTVVVFTTDHGIAFPEMKCNLTAHGTGVALILKSAGQLAGGRALDGLVSHMDLPPTLCELLGVCPMDGGHGSSFAGPLRGETGWAREDAFAEVNFHASAGPARSVRTREFNYIRHFGEDLRRRWANVDDGPSKDVWMQLWRGAPLERVQLFDVRRDPQERRNLADRPEFQAVRDEMEARLRAWMEKTDDPLLRGPLQIPPGASINPADCIRPGSKDYLPAP